jgi:hypothetical protein
LPNNISRLLAVATLAIASATITSCGPPLTDPGSGDLTGTWFSPGPAAGLTNVTMTLTQGGDGAISGTYTATGSPSLQACPATGPCAMLGTVTGANTAFQVFFDLKDAGQFTGQLITASELKGAMNRSSTTEPIVFTK